MIEEQDIPFVTKHFSFYEHLDENHKRQFLSQTNRVFYSAGTQLKAGAEACLGTILIQSGTLRIYMISPEGREITLFSLQDTDVCTLSASCVFIPKTVNVHISAMSDVSAFLIPLVTFKELSTTNIYVENFSSKIMIARFSSVMETLEQIIFDRVDNRIIRYLLNQSEQSGTTIHITQEALAQNTGTVREKANAVLKTLSENHLIENRRGTITLLDKETLAQMLTQKE